MAYLYDIPSSNVISGLIPGYLIGMIYHIILAPGYHIGHHTSTIYSSLGIILGIIPARYTVTLLVYDSRAV